MRRWGFTFPLDGLPLSAHRDALREAESLGYTDAWTAEVDGTDAFVPLAVAAACTDKLRLGSAIANVFTRGPALLAQTAAAVAEAAPGRFCLGLGASSPAIVERWNGLKLREPLRRVEETVAFVRAAFSGEKTASEALGVQGFRLGRRFPDVSGPPIFIAALRPKMLQLAGRLGEGVITNWLAPNDVPKVAAVARAAAKDAGRDPDALEVACRIFVLPPLPDAALRTAGRWAIAAYLTTPVYSAFHRWLGRGEALRPMLEAWQAGDRSSALELVPEGLVEELFVMGGRQECLDKIEAYCRNGVTLPILAFSAPPGDPQQQAAFSLARLRDLAPPA